MAAIVAEAERHAGVGTESEQVTRPAMVIALQAVMDWAGRYAEAADAAARRAIDPLIRAAHLRVAEACRRVPAQPARDLFEGLQAIVLIHLALHIEGHGLSVSIGLPDRVLAPFVDDSLDHAETVDLVGAFLLKIAANSIFGRGSKTQAITVGGATCEVSTAASSRILRSIPTWPQIEPNRSYRSMWPEPGRRLPKLRVGRSILPRPGDARRLRAQPIGRLTSVTV